MLYGKDAVSACQTSSNSNMIRMSGSAHLGAVLPTLTLTTLKLLVRETASFPAELLSLQCIKCIGTWDFAGKAHSAPQVPCWIFLVSKRVDGEGMGREMSKKEWALYNAWKSAWTSVVCRSETALPATMITNEKKACPPAGGMNLLTDKLFPRDM